MSSGETSLPRTRGLSKILRAGWEVKCRMQRRQRPGSKRWMFCMPRTVSGRRRVQGPQVSVIVDKLIKPFLMPHL